MFKIESAARYARYYSTRASNSAVWMAPLKFNIRFRTEETKLLKRDNYIRRMFNRASLLHTPYLLIDFLCFSVSILSILHFWSTKKRLNISMFKNLLFLKKDIIQPSGYYLPVLVGFPIGVSLKCGYAKNGKKQMLVGILELWLCSLKLHHYATYHYKKRASRYLFSFNCY